MRRILRRTFDGPLKYLACQAGSVQSEERICLYFSIRLFTTQKLTHERIRRGGTCENSTFAPYRNESAVMFN